MSTTIIIPARMASVRLPHKPLADILGKSMIRRVYERCMASKYADNVIIATDHQEIYNHAKAFGAEVFMTSTDHESGTDRIGEVCNQIDTDIVINVQGDEPLINPAQIDELVLKFKDPKVEIATQKIKIHEDDILFDYNIVKVVTDIHDKALYFSRQAIPAFRDLPYSKWMDRTSYFKHVGIYAFRSQVLKEIIKLPQTELEKAESLEQLRWLSHGYTIYCFETKFSSISVDTEEDVQKVIQFLLTEMNR